MNKKIKCPHCNNLMDARAKQCLGCYHKEKKVSSFCIDCGVKLWNKTITRCRTCWLKSKPLTNEKNPNWSGKEVGKDGVHSWVRRHKPKPKLCEECKKVPPYDLANISQEYKRDVNDFEWLCRKCHMKSDGRLEIFKQLRKR